MPCGNVFVQSFVAGQPSGYEYICWTDEGPTGENTRPDDGGDGGTSSGITGLPQPPYGPNISPGNRDGVIIIGVDDSDTLPPPRPVVSVNPGWNGGAHSILTVPPDWRGMVSFSLPDVDGAKQGGAAVGLIPVSRLPVAGRSGYAHMPYGLVVTSAYVHVIHAGVVVVDLPYGDLRALREPGDTADKVQALMYGTYMKWVFNGQTLHAGGFALEEPYALDATLYLALDAVDDPKFTEGDWPEDIEDGSLNGELPAYQMEIDAYSDSGITAELPAYAARFSEEEFWDLVGELPAYRMVAGDTDVLVAELPAFAMVMADTTTYGALMVSLPAYEMVAGMELADETVHYAMLTGALPRYAMSMEMPGIITLDAVLPAYEMRMSATVSYAELRAELPAYSMKAYSGEMTPFIPIAETLGARMPIYRSVYVALVLAERIGGSVQALGYMTITAEAVERISAEDVTNCQTTVFQAVMETLGAGERLLVFSRRLDGSLDDGGEAWAVNTRTQASSRYDQYGFNSFAVVGGKQFGAREDGLYLLEGQNDAGRPIVSGVNLGQHDFGSLSLKHVGAVYAGVSSTGTLFLKVSDGRGEFTYRARRKDDRMKVQRFDPGRGLEAIYFEFKLVSEGDAFELDTVNFDIVASQRRI